MPAPRPFFPGIHALRAVAARICPSHWRALIGAAVAFTLVGLTAYVGPYVSTMERKAVL